MSRWEFMRQLEALLFDISPSEREEALQYYNDYFNDAGRENEQEVMKALGSPEQVAKIVKEGLLDNPEMGEFTENGFSSSGNGNKNAIIENPSGEEGMARSDTKDTKDTKESSQKAKKGGMPVWAVVLIVIGCILGFPIIIGVAGTLLGLIVTVICSVLGLIFGFGLSMVILFIIGIALIVAGFGCIIYDPIVAIGLWGGGLICLAFGILFLLLTVFFAGKVLPGTCQGIGYIFKKLFGKKEVADHE